jgi:exodeoxyribonuclease III
MVCVLTVASANVNGIRAAVRRGIGRWLADRSPDVLCLQEVRAEDGHLADALGDGWQGVHDRCDAPGRAGVAVMTRHPVREVRRGLPGADGVGFNGTGSWVEADLELPGSGVLTVVSVYVHKGQADTPKQEEKYRFLDAVSGRLNQLWDRAGTGPDAGHVLVCGDVNIAHENVDLKNWKGNLRNAGFLPRERAWIDEVLAAGWVDVQRAFAGPGPGPYSWWSWRGRAFDNDAGWRVDYQLATPGLAARVTDVATDRAPSYEERWSDHAAIVATYDV